MWKRFLWLSGFLVVLCSCAALVYAGGAFAAGRYQTVTAMMTEHTPAEVPKDCSGFPLQVDGTTLIAASLSMYEGDMLEDDSDTFLVDAAALELYNYGTREVELAEITLTVEQEELTFFGTNIPPSSRVLIIEQDGAPWRDGICTGVAGWAKYTQDTALTASQLQIDEVGLGNIQVSNLTDSVLEDVWIFYKNYLSEGQIYLGGITYIEIVPSLEPGEKLLISPQRYVAGYSKVVKAKELG